MLLQELSAHQAPQQTLGGDHRKALVLLFQHVPQGLTGLHEAQEPRFTWFSQGFHMIFTLFHMVFTL